MTKKITALALCGIVTLGIVGFSGCGSTNAETKDGMKDGMADKMTHDKMENKMGDKMGKDKM